MRGLEEWENNRLELEEEEESVLKCVKCGCWKREEECINHKKIKDDKGKALIFCDEICLENFQQQDEWEWNEQ